MGQTLSFPALHKHKSSGGNASMFYSTTAMQGWRVTMEDAHVAELSLDKGVETSNAFFAVYNGHSGVVCGAMSKFSGTNVHKRLMSEGAYHEERYEEALKSAFLGTDEDWCANPPVANDPSGCTAVAALVTGDGKIFVANAGDSRLVISVKGKAKPLSLDHKPSNKNDAARIKAAGGYVEYTRVNGRLGLSRALGDFDLKKNPSLSPEEQIITADPDMTIHDIAEEDEFLVLACDGIWECLSSQEVVDFIRLKVSKGNELPKISKMLCDYCLAPDTEPPSNGCDNMMVLIIAILNGQSIDEWRVWVTDHVKQRYGYKMPGFVPQLYDKYQLKKFNAQ
ncbi:hypothetical protein PILCRDRAFT_98887 [Piloderma croceum F 1598]|uniref:protein-serine/threonine phosphatase n=1 Tax=Piloderma croceum (strain F 1598) TaxID=765440 RepID=A0A0C3BE19_PILCF|nr:hypothetical protein PILCRDRAFT_98887 [Piloderma croceum F 1598]